MERLNERRRKKFLSMENWINSPYQSDRGYPWTLFILSESCPIKSQQSSSQSPRSSTLSQVDCILGVHDCPRHDHGCGLRGLPLEFLKFKFHDPPLQVHDCLPKSTIVDFVVSGFSPIVDFALFNRGLEKFFSFFFLSMTSSKQRFFDFPK